jgi:ABC-2 type transport system permease protein
LAGFWLVGVFLIPRFGNVLAEQLYPAPSSFAFDQRIDKMRLEGIDGHGPANEELLKTTLAKYGVDSLSQLPVNFAAISLQASEEADAAIYDIVYHDLYDQFRRQEVWLRYVGLLSPFQTFQNLCMAVSGTDVHTHLHFADQVERHRRDMQLTLNTYYQANTTGSDALWQSVPPFSYQAAGIHQRMQLAWADVGVLMAWLLLATMVVWLSLQQFKLT